MRWEKMNMTRARYPLALIQSHRWIEGNTCNICLVDPSWRGYVHPPSVMRLVFVPELCWGHFLDDFGPVWPRTGTDPRCLTQHTVPTSEP